MSMLLTILFRIVDFYEILVLAYCIMSWFPPSSSGLLADIRAVLSSVVEPFLNVFRRVIPPLGGIDFTPVIAILVLQLAERLILRLFI